jgi:hypothetical protein
MRSHPPRSGEEIITLQTVRPPLPVAPEAWPHVAFGYARSRTYQDRNANGSAFSPCGSRQLAARGPFSARLSAPFGPPIVSIDVHLVDAGALLLVVDGHLLVSSVSMSSSSSRQPLDPRPERLEVEDARRDPDRKCIGCLPSTGADPAMNLAGCALAGRVVGVRREQLGTHRSIETDNHIPARQPCGVRASRA